MCIKGYQKTLSALVFVSEDLVINTVKMITSLINEEETEWSFLFFWKFRFFSTHAAFLCSEGRREGKKTKTTTRTFHIYCACQKHFSSEIIHHPQSFRDSSSIACRYHRPMNIEGVSENYVVKVRFSGSLLMAQNEWFSLGSIKSLYPDCVKW